MSEELPEWLVDKLKSDDLWIAVLVGPFGDASEAVIKLVGSAECLAKKGITMILPGPKANARDWADWMVKVAEKVRRSEQ